MSPNAPTRRDIIQAILSNPKLSEEEKSILVEEFINEIKREYPDLKYHATKQDVSETELKLTKEIKEIEANLTKDIENVRKEVKEIEANLTKEIENTRKEIKETKFTMIKWSFIFWISQISVIIGMGFFIYKVLVLKG